MLFSKYARNRHCKQKSNWSGQIFPVLLICLAGLIVAYSLTRIVGEANIAKTCASNAADSGSLSAASCWAGAFNRLIYRNWDKYSNEQWLGGVLGVGNLGNYMGYATGPFNTYYYYKEMRHYYVQMRDSYKLLYEKGNGYLKDFPTDSADYYIQKAINHIDGSVIPAGTLQCSQTWDTSVAQQSFLDAADDIEEAAYCVGAFYICTAYMGEGNYGALKNGITSWFKKYQMQNLCDAITFMDEQYKRAIQTGQYYALSNSGYSSKLTNAQADAFDFWLGGEQRGVFPITGNSLSYPPTPTPGMCGVTVTMTLPKIANYEIKMALWNYPWPKLVPIPITCQDIIYCSDPKDCDDAGVENGDFIAYSWPAVPVLDDDPFNTKGSEYLTNVLFKIRDYLKRLAVLLQIIDNLTDSAADCCTCVCNGGTYGSCGTCNCTTPPLPAPQVETCDAKHHRCNFDEKYDLAVKIRDKLVTEKACIIALLKRIKDDTGPSLSVKALKAWNVLIWLNLWPDPTGGCNIKPFSDLTCDQVKNYSDEHSCAITEPPHKGMMVINIDKVTLDDESWETSCNVEVSCGGTSFSKSKFCGEGWPCSGKGDLVGKFSDIYYPEITDIQK